MFHISRENDERFVRGSFGTSREGALLLRLSDAYWRVLDGADMGPVYRGLLQECMLDRSEEVWRRAGLAACRLADRRPAFCDYWLGLANHPEIDVRLRQIELLNRTPRALADRLSARLADDPSPFVRLSLINRLGEVGSRSAKSIRGKCEGSRPDSRSRTRSDGPYGASRPVIPEGAARGSSSGI